MAARLSADLNHNLDGPIFPAVRRIKGPGVFLQIKGMRNHLGNIYLPFLHELQGGFELGWGIPADAETTQMEGRQIEDPDRPLGIRIFRQGFDRDPSVRGQRSRGQTKPAPGSHRREE